MGLKSPDAPAYLTRSVRVSSCVTAGPSSPSLTSSKYSFCAAMGGMLVARATFPPVTTFITTFQTSGDGIRLAVKDLIDMAGVPTTAGCAAVADTAAPAVADAP